MNTTGGCISKPTQANYCHESSFSSTSPARQIQIGTAWLVIIHGQLWYSCEWKAGLYFGRDWFRDTTPWWIAGTDGKMVVNCKNYCKKYQLDRYTCISVLMRQCGYQSPTLPQTPCTGTQIQPGHFQYNLPTLTNSCLFILDQLALNQTFISPKPNTLRPSPSAQLASPPIPDYLFAAASAYKIHACSFLKQVSNIWYIPQFHVMIHHSLYLHIQPQLKLNLNKYSNDSLSTLTLHMNPLRLFWLVQIYMLLIVHTMVKQHNSIHTKSHNCSNSLCYIMRVLYNVFWNQIFI